MAEYGVTEERREEVRRLLKKHGYKDFIPDNGKPGWTIEQALQWDEFVAFVTEEMMIACKGDLPNLEYMATYD